MENYPTDFVNPNKKPPRKRRSGFFRGLCLHIFATAQTGQWHFFERFVCENGKPRGGGTAPPGLNQAE